MNGAAVILLARSAASDEDKLQLKLSSRSMIAEISDGDASQTPSLVRPMCAMQPSLSRKTATSLSGENKPSPLVFVETQHTPQSLPAASLPKMRPALVLASSLATSSGCDQLKNTRSEISLSASTLCLKSQPFLHSRTDTNFGTT